MHHLKYSCGNPARPRPGENTAVVQYRCLFTDVFTSCKGWAFKDNDCLFYLFEENNKTV